MLPSGGRCSVRDMWQYSGTGAATDPLGVETAGGAAVVAVGLRGCVMTRAGVLSVTGSRYDSLGQWGGGGWVGRGKLVLAG